MNLRRFVAVAMLAACLLIGAAADAQEARFEGRTLAEWIADLTGGAWEERVTAAWALGEIGPPAAPAVPHLLRALEDQDESLRMFSAHALGGIGQATNAVLAALQKAINDPDAEVRAEAAWALEQLQAAAPPAEPATAPEPTTVPPTVQPEPPPAAEPTTVPTTIEPEAPRLHALLPEGEARTSVRSAVLQSHSLGLLDEAGNQLNPNVPPGAISLTPGDLNAHAALMAGGRCRTIADVVDFLASFDVRLAATGRTITVEDLLPDLQRYVTWSFAHQDDPRSSLGILLASGPLIRKPATAPEISGQTAISPIAALLMLADLLGGVEQPEGDAGWGRLQGGPGQGGTLFAALGDALPRMLAAAGDPLQSGLEKIRGVITQIQLTPELVAMRQQSAWGWAHRLLALFECQSRLTVRIERKTGGTAWPIGGVRAEWRGDGWWTRTTGDWVKDDIVPLIASVGFVSSDGSIIDMPFDRFNYTVRLLRPLVAAETLRTFGLGFGGPEAGGWLVDMMTSGIEAAGVEAGTLPLATGADARLVERMPGGERVPRGHRMERTDRAAPFELAFSRAEGETIPAESPFGVAQLRANATIGAVDFLELWLRYVEPIRVAGLTLAEDEALLQVGVDKILDITPCVCPIVFERVTGEKPLLTATDLLGSWTMPQWATEMHLRLEGGGVVSGKCALGDNRASDRWKWITLLGSFRGQMTEYNPDYEHQREHPESRDGLGRIHVGKFEATGTWRGAYHPPGAEMGDPVRRGLTGELRVRGTLMEAKGGYEAGGEVAYEEDGDWLRFSASEHYWRESLKAVREAGITGHFPTWEKPEWLEEDDQ